MDFLSAMPGRAYLAGDDGSILLRGTTPFIYDGKAGQIIVVADDGAAAWRANHPQPHNGQYFEFENGAAGNTSQGLNGFAFSSAGAGAARVGLTGEPGWFQNAASIETGTTTTGNYILTRPSGVSFSSVTGLWAFELTFSVPVLSDGTDTYSLCLGFSDNASGIIAVDGAYLRYTHGTNSGKFEFVTASNSTRTVTDTGITLVAGSYYHLRIEVTNDTEARCYLKTTAATSAGPWTDNGVWDTPTVTTATNIPSGTARNHSACVSILKSAGTTSRKLKVGYQRLSRTPVYGGGSVGDISTALTVDAAGADQWTAPGRVDHPFVFSAYGRGGWLPAVSAEFGNTLSGGSGSLSAATAANGHFGTTNLNTGAAADGAAAFNTSVTLQLDSSVTPMIVEGVFAITTLSTAAQKVKFSVGLLDSVTTTIASGAWLEIDSDAAVAMQCKVGLSGTITTTSSSLTIVAATAYAFRLVITSTNVDFYLKADAATAWGAPVASIATNLPIGVPLCVGAVNRKAVGTTNRSAQFMYLLAYQRSLTA